MKSQVNMLAREYCDTAGPAPPNHPRADAEQLQKSIPRMYRGITVKSPFPLPLA
jgi:hypothetical protein